MKEKKKSNERNNNSHGRIHNKYMYIYIYFGRFNYYLYSAGNLSQYNIIFRFGNQAKRKYSNDI